MLADGSEGVPSVRSAQPLMIFPSGEELKPTEDQHVDFEVAAAHISRIFPATQVLGYTFDGLVPASLSEVCDDGGFDLVYWHLASRQHLALLQSVESVLRPEIPLIVGGDFAGRFDLDLMSRLPRIDAVVRGEIELTLEALCRTVVAGDSSWRQERGITVRQADGSVSRTKARPLAEDLDGFALNIGAFAHRGRHKQGHKIHTSRGCNSDCQYCGLQTIYRLEFPGIKKFWRSRSAGSIVEEMEYLRHKCGVSKFFFNSFVVFGYDDGDAAVLREVANLVLEKGLDIEFGFVTLARDLYRNLDLLPLLKQAGLRQLTLGVDSGLERVLEMYEVGFSRPRIVECLKALSELQIRFHTSFIFYDPYLTLEEVLENLEFIATLRQFYEFTGVPFSFFLDQQILNTVLQVHARMPIYQKLVIDGLAEEVDPLTDKPRVGFKFAVTGKLFQLHQLCNREVMPTIRPLLFDIQAVQRSRDLELLPLRLVEFIAKSLRDQPTEVSSVQPAVYRWLAGQLASSWSHLEPWAESHRSEAERIEKLLASLASAEPALRKEA